MLFFPTSSTKAVTTAWYLRLLLILTAAVLATAGYESRRRSSTNNGGSGSSSSSSSCRSSGDANDCATDYDSSPKTRPIVDNIKPQFDFFGDILPDHDDTAAVNVNNPPDDDYASNEPDDKVKEEVFDRYNNYKSSNGYDDDDDDDDDVFFFDQENNNGVKNENNVDDIDDEENDIGDDDEEDCVDVVDYCDALVARGECKYYIDFMHENCQFSCKMCAKNTESCYDDDDDCSMWAEDGECVKRPAYMLKNCRASCGVCMTGEICQDNHEYCPTWAESGECEKDPSFMYHSCKKSCNICIGNKAIDLGVIQIITGDEDKSRLYMHNSLKYLTTKILPDEDLLDVHQLCTNTYTNCVDLAVEGECKTDSLYEDILTDCPLACRSCKMLHEAIRCGYDPDAEGALEDGELDLFFEKNILGNIESLKYMPRVLSRPYPPETKPERNAASYQVVDNDPWLILYDSFLTNDECDRLVALGMKQGYEDSKVVGDELVEGDHPDEFGEERKSKQTWCDASCERDAVTQRIMKRVSDVTGISVDNQESFQLLKYDKGDYYLLHGDFLYENKYFVPGPRILTFYFYLNDGFEGGETFFTELGIKITPKKGSAILWPNALNENLFERDPSTDHEALPVKRGVKYGANLWIHLRDYKNPEKNGCS